MSESKERALLREWRETYGGSTHSNGKPVSADLEARTDALLAVPSERAAPYGYCWFDKNMEHRFTRMPPKNGVIGDVKLVYEAPPIGRTFHTATLAEVVTGAESMAATGASATHVIELFRAMLAASPTNEEQSNG